MAQNPYVNRVETADGTTLMDISDTTATEGDVISGKTLYKANGQKSVGTLDINGKADKVANATSGNFAGLDANGNLMDSGKGASDFAAPASVASGTLAAGSWTSATPPTQTISVTGVTASSNIIVGIASTATSTQYDEAVAAKLLCTAQGTDEITVTCYGTEPTGNIPITVMIVG